MNKFKIILVLAGLFVCVYCKSQQDNGKIYNQYYFIDTIPGFRNFEIYTDNENRIDSIHNHYDKFTDSLFNADSSYNKQDPIDKSDFRNNRSRIFLNYYTNDKSDKPDSSFAKGFPTPCDCFVSKDSIFINMGAGFFGGFGINIEINENKASSSFYEYTDDVRPFKSKLSDTIYDSFVSIRSKYQYLILTEQPNFRSGEHISGYLTMTSNYYYEKLYDDKIDTHFVKSKVYFTCKTKNKIRLNDK